MRGKDSERSKRCQQVPTSMKSLSASFASARSRMPYFVLHAQNLDARSVWESGWLSRGSNALTVDVHCKFTNSLIADSLRRSLSTSIPWTNLSVLEVALLPKPIYWRTHRSFVMNMALVLTIFVRHARFPSALSVPCLATNTRNISS